MVFIICVTVIIAFAICGIFLTEIYLKREKLDSRQILIMYGHLTSKLYNKNPMDIALFDNVQS